MHIFRPHSSLLIASAMVGIFIGLIAVKFKIEAPEFGLPFTLILILVIWKRSLISLIVLFVFGLYLGLQRGVMFLKHIENIESLYGQEITIVGKVIDDAAYNQKSQREFHISSLQLIEPHETSLPGNIRVRAYGIRSISRGDLIKVQGNIYPALGNRLGSISFGKVETLSRNTGLVEKLRSAFFAGVQTVIPEPQSSLGLGFLVGVRTTLPDLLTTQLSVTGLTHIVAVSGYNLTILIRITRKILAKFSAFLSVILSASLVGVFLMFAGSAPSIARAATVTAIALPVWYFGRSINPLNLLLISATITGLINPFYVWFDIGWWLSVSAFFGVLIIAPLISNRIFKERPKLLGQLIIETTSAQIMALPIIVAIFGELSLISLLANVLVLPLIPFAMMFTFIAGLSGVIGGIVTWLSWPAGLLLRYITDVIELLADIPWALLEIETSWESVAYFYLVILLLSLILWRKNPRPLSGTEVIE